MQGSVFDALGVNSLLSSNTKGQAGHSCRCLSLTSYLVSMFQMEMCVWQNTHRTQSNIKSEMIQRVENEPLDSQVLF